MPTNAPRRIVLQLRDREKQEEEHEVRTVFCRKLGREAEGLDFAPLPGPNGQRVYEQVSKEAWSQWLAHQTMLINENRLSPLDPKTRAFLAAEMEKFLFEGVADPPAGYVPPQS